MYWSGSHLVLVSVDLLNSIHMNLETLRKTCHSLIDIFLIHCLLIGCIHCQQTALNETNIHPCKLSCVRNRSQTGQPDCHTLVLDCATIM